ncbi:MAG: c-type cytochrome [Deltaproteobacteria bacterium]|nr:c-type cytochrome [Deltaproteobacteria bacterium]
MRIASLLVLAACGTELPPPPDVSGYPELPSDPQRAGDPAKGYDYLVNGGYITCGIPRSAYDQVVGPADPGISGRTGANASLPYDFSAAMSKEGVPVVSANCLTCHAGSINGQLVVGLGAADRNFTSDQMASYVDAAGSIITDPTEKAEWQRFDDRIHAIAPYTKTLTIGVNSADSLTAALMAHRDPATLAWLDQPRLDAPMIVAPVDVPPWWRMQKKHVMFYTAAGRGDHARIEMAASLLCTDSVDEARAIDAAFVDVRAWIETLQAPKWPFAIDQALAARGKPVFEKTCSRCHGTYGDSPTYPNLLIPVDVVATDPLLATGTAEFSPDFVQWFAQSFWGETSHLDPQPGYVAPPLDGIWATAPFFHNGSVPTLEGVLDSSKRPTYWVRTSYDSTDFDPVAVGWNFTAITHGQAMEPTQTARVKIYDTTLDGYHNTGHPFGDALSSDDRRAVIEYLKSL